MPFLGPSRITVRSFAATAVLAIAACATPYQSAGLDSNGGFSVMQLAPGTYKVMFQANQWTSPQRVKDFTYLCAAQVSLEHNYPYFEVLGRSNEGQITVVPPSRRWVPARDEDHHHGRHHHHDYRVYHPGHWTTDPGYTVATPGLGLMIKGLETPAEAGKHAGKIYDAAQLQQFLERRYHIHPRPRDPLPTAPTTAPSR